MHFARCYGCDGVGRVRVLSRRSGLIIVSCKKCDGTGVDKQFFVYLKKEQERNLEKNRPDDP